MTKPAPVSFEAGPVHTTLPTIPSTTSRFGHRWTTCSVTFCKALKDVQIPLGTFAIAAATCKFAFSSRVYALNMVAAAIFLIALKLFVVTFSTQENPRIRRLHAAFLRLSDYSVWLLIAATATIFLATRIHVAAGCALAIINGAILGSINPRSANTQVVRNNLASDEIGG